MSWYEFLLFVHVACAAIWIGGGFIFQIYGMVVERGGDPGEMAQFAGRAGAIGSGCSFRRRCSCPSPASG